MQTIAIKGKIAKENIRAQIDKKDGNKEASTFEERCQELEEKIKNKKLQPAKSDLKQWRRKKPRGRQKLKQK